MLAIVISEKSTGAVWVGSYMCDEELMEKSHFEPSCSQILHLPLNLLKESRHSAWNYKVLSLSAGTPLTPSTKRFQSWAKWRSTLVAPASQLPLATGTSVDFLHTQWSRYAWRILITWPGLSSAGNPSALHMEPRTLDQYSWWMLVGSGSDSMQYPLRKFISQV